MKTEGIPRRRTENIPFKSRFQWAHLEADSSEQLLTWSTDDLAKSACRTQPSVFSCSHLLCGSDPAWSPAPSHPDNGCLTLI